MRPCFEHADPSCQDPRCLVSLRCHAEVPTDDPESWLEKHYPQALSDDLVVLPVNPDYRAAWLIADRLLDWVRSAQDPHPLDGAINKRSRFLLVPSEGNDYDWAGLLPVWDWLDANGAWSLVHEFRVVQRLSPEALLSIAALLGIPAGVEDLEMAIQRRFVIDDDTVLGL